jgi:hypothetical protein
MKTAELRVRFERTHFVSKGVLQQASFEILFGDFLLKFFGLKRFP